MYTEFYGLREKPFALAPDPRYIFMGRSHREAFAHLLYGVEQGEGFIEVIGQIGTGKTTLCRTLLDRIGSDVEIAFIFNPSPNETELLKSISREFVLPTTGRNRSELIEELNSFLLEKKRHGRRVLLVIDEAQNLDPNVLEQVRLLSNLETEREKLVQIVLIGQPELDENLSRSDLRQLRQRITVRWSLGPFTRDEVGQYLEHRLRVAGLHGPNLFTPGAARAMYRVSRGIPRIVNAVADRALLAGYSQGRRRVDAREVRRAARELPGADVGWLASTGLSGWSVGLLLLFGLGFGLVASALRPPVEELPDAAPTAEDAALTVGGALAAVAAPATELRPLDVSRDLLGAELLRLSRDGSAAAALDSLLAAWGHNVSVGAEIDPNLFPSVVRRFSPLRVLPVRLTRDEISSIDLPAILELHTIAGDARFATLLGLEQGDRVRVAVGGQDVALEGAELDRLWTGRAFLLWMNYESLPVLSPGMTGSAVRWLQARLTDLGYLQPGDASEEYDALTASAVRRFQVFQGLPTTGELDPKTMIALYHSLDYGAPRLLHPSELLGAETAKQLGPWKSSEAESQSGETF